LFHSSISNYNPRQIPIPHLSSVETVCLEASRANLAGLFDMGMTDARSRRPLSDCIVNGKLPLHVSHIRP
jgi:hypothetical protein